MKKAFIIVAAITAFVYACSRVPITGRKQYNIVPQSTVLSMAEQEYTSFIQQSSVVKNTPEAAMVQKVGSRLSAAVEKYFRDNNMSSSLEGYKWEYNLVQSNEVNAFCMPGGKIVVYTGILPYTKDEVGLATVLGHEVSHAVARHGNERMSQGLTQQLGGLALDVALVNRPAETRNLFLMAYGATTTYGVILPYSRTHELEADRLGLIFMAMAGYDPSKAVDFWQRMSASGGQAPAEFMSTHPSDERRIREIQEHLPEANKYYKPI